MVSMVIFSWGLTRNVSLRSWYLKGLCARLIVARQSREWYSGRCDAAASIAPMAVAIVGALVYPTLPAGRRFTRIPPLNPSVWEYLLIWVDTVFSRLDLLNHCKGYLLNNPL